MVILSYSVAMTASPLPDKNIFGKEVSELEKLSDALNQLELYRHARENEPSLMNQMITQEQDHVPPNSHRVCEWLVSKGEFLCEKSTKPLTIPIPLPMNSCETNSCKTCLQGNRVYIFDKISNTPIPIDDSMLTLLQKNDTVQGITKTIHCKNHKTQEYCSCTELNNCVGFKAACDEISLCLTVPADNVFSDENCICTLGQEGYTMAVVHNGFTLHDPITVTFPYCLYDLNKIINARQTSLFKLASLKRTTRQINEDSLPILPAVKPKLTMFDNLVSTMGPGTLIFQKDGLQFDIVISSSTETYTAIPQDFYLKSGNLIIYFSPLDSPIEKLIYPIVQRTVCQRINCLFCMDIFYYPNCLPNSVTYTFYGIGAIILLGVLYYIVLLIHGIKAALFALSYSLKFLVRIIKLTLQFILLVALFLSQQVKLLYNRTVVRMQVAQALPAILLALTLVVPFALGCNDFRGSDAKVLHCESVDSNIQSCKIERRFTMNLHNLKYTNCMDFYNEADNTSLLHLQLTYEKVTCTLMTRRLYYTSPYKVKKMTDRMCAHNEQCSMGANCHRGYKTRKFKALNPDFPGETDCVYVQQSSPKLSELADVIFGVMFECPTLFRCLFYHYYFEPDYDQLYEVREITGSVCIPTIAMRSVDTTGHVKESMFNGSFVSQDMPIRVNVLGTFNLNELIVSDKIIQKVSDPSVTYLMPASAQNHPELHMIGDIQLKNIADKEFLVNPKIYECKAKIKPTDELICLQEFSPLTKVDENGNFKLDENMESMKFPLHRGFHFMFIDTNSQVMTSLMHPAAVQVQLEFDNFEVRVRYDKVCPVLKDDFIVIGCYACLIPVMIRFTAYSTCGTGSVQVFLKGTEYAKHFVKLEMNLPRTYEYEFMSDDKEFDTEICLQTLYSVECQPIDFILDEPEVKLDRHNETYVHETITSRPSSDKAANHRFEWNFNWESVKYLFTAKGAIEFFTWVPRKIFELLFNLTDYLFPALIGIVAAVAMLFLIVFCYGMCSDYRAKRYHKVN